LFAFFFTIFVNMSGKKFDRYLLPVFAPLDIVAALGWVTLVENFFQNRLDWRLSAFRSSPAVWLSSAALILGVIFVQVVTILQTQPYYFTYYNSLLGGIQKASEVMMIGWGEGLDLAARYLNSKPDATELSVHSWYEEVFAYSFNGKAVQRSFDPEATELENVDYLVLYVNQWQRELPSPSFLTLFDGLQPEYVVRINEMEYARIYNMKK
jgi:hypothetical protein